MSLSERRSFYGGVLPASHDVTRSPSEHYGGHLVLASSALLDVVADFVDGKWGTPVAPIEIMPLVENGDFARLALLDVTVAPGWPDRAFVIDIWTRPEPDESNEWDLRGSPILLDDFRQARRWQIYNWQPTQHPRTLC